MSLNRKPLTRWAAGCAAAAVLLGAAAPLAHADEKVDDTNVDISVTIEKQKQPGFLSLSVAANSVQLKEDGSDQLRRQFVGTLPTVTVTDTRDADEVPAGAAWSVLGTVTDFKGSAGQPDIDAGHLGWNPALVGTNDGDGLVAAGDQVDTVLDSGPAAVGLKDNELLASTWDSEEVREEGSWKANAELFLRTPVDVAPGNYSSVLTLSLFE